MTQQVNNLELEKTGDEAKAAWITYIKAVILVEKAYREAMTTAWDAFEEEVKGKGTKRRR